MKGDGLRAMATTWQVTLAINQLWVTSAAWPLQLDFLLCNGLGHCAFWELTHSLLIFTSDRQMPVGPLKGINMSLVSSSPFPSDLITLLPGMSYLATAESPLVPG